MLHFFDIDEFLYIQDEVPINTFLENYTDQYSIFINWRIFGDNNLSEVINDNYSITRFTKCGKTLDPFGKHIINIKKIVSTPCEFINPHVVGFFKKIENEEKIFELKVFSPSLEKSVENGKIFFDENHFEKAELYHFKNKTFQERFKRCFQKPSVFYGNNKKQHVDIDSFKEDFEKYNINEMDNFNIVKILKES